MATPPYPFAFAAATKLYAANARPRLLLSSKDIEAIKTITETHDGQAIMRTLRQRCDEIADHVEQSGDDLDALFSDALCEPHLGGRQLTSLDDLAVLAQLLDVPRFAAAVRRILLAAVQYDQRDLTLRYTLIHGSARTICAAFDLVYDSLSEAERTAILDWFWHIGIQRFMNDIGLNHIRRGGHNMAVRKMQAALFCLLAMGQDANAYASADAIDQLRRDLITMLDASLWPILGSDGFPHEDIGYGAATLGVIIPLVDALRRAGWADAYQRHHRILQAGAAYLHFVQPWGTDLAVLGDHGDSFADRDITLGRLGVETHDPTVLWLMTQLRYPTQTAGQWSELTHFHRDVALQHGGQLPASWYSLLVLPHLASARHPSAMRTSTHFIEEERGIISQRTSWAEDALLLLIDSAQRNTATRSHEHDSAGHVSLTAFGEYFGIARGRYNQRRAFQNVVEVEQPPDGDDGWGSRPFHGRLIHHATKGLSSWTRIDASQQANARWSYRDIGLVQGPGLTPYVWIVDDANFDDGKSGERRYHWQWNTAPANQVTIDNSIVNVQGCQHGRQMRLYFAVDTPNQIGPAQPELSCATTRCGSPGYVSDDRVRQRREEAAGVPNAQVHGPVFECPQIQATVVGRECKMLSLLLPLDPQIKKQDLPSFTPLSPLPATVGFELRTPRVIDTFLFAFDHGVLRHKDIDGLGRWCLVRQDAQTGTVLDSQLAGGQWLQVAGTRLD